MFAIALKKRPLAALAIVAPAVAFGFWAGGGPNRQGSRDKDEARR